MRYLTFALMITLFLSSCVSMKKHEDLQALTDRYRAEKEDCLQSLEDTKESLANAQSAKSSLESELSDLKEELDGMKRQNEKLAATVNEYEAMNDNLTKSQKELIDYTSAQQDQLLKELAAKEKQLEEKEAALNALSKSIDERESALAKLQGELQAKSNRIDELEANLAAKDAALSELKGKIKEALKNFTSEELTVVEKDGKVYVSLSENLLFSSGSFAIDAKGEQALEQLAEVLKLQKDVDIVVEGHTDNVPYNGSGQLKDNWDLSVKRATTVTRILVQNGLPTDNLSAAGKADTKPVATNDTKEGRAKNRRTEIILSPQLDKLFEIIEGKE